MRNYTINNKYTNKTALFSLAPENQQDIPCLSFRDLYIYPMKDVADIFLAIQNTKAWKLKTSTPKITRLNPHNKLFIDVLKQTVKAKQSNKHKMGIL